MSPAPANSTTPLLPRAAAAGVAPRPPAPLLRAQETFAQTISRAQERPGARDPVVEARTSAEQLVSLALVEPALKSLRESSMAAAPFAPTGAEKQFGAMLDSQRAADIVRSANMPLVDRLMRDLLGRAGVPVSEVTDLRAGQWHGQTTPAPAPATHGHGAFHTMTMDLIT